MTFILGFIASACIGASVGIQFKSWGVGAAVFFALGLLYQILWAVSA